MKAEDFNDLVQSIVELFPEEEICKSIYYEPSHVVKDENESKIGRVNSKGFLHSSYSKLKDLLRSVNIITASSRQITRNKGIIFIRKQLVVFIILHIFIMYFAKLSL